MYFLFRLLLSAVVAKFAYGEKPQQYVSASYAQTNNPFPSDLDIQYPVQKSSNEEQQTLMQKQDFDSNNAIYEQNIPFNGYVPQDIVQQYANSYNPGNNVALGAQSGFIANPYGYAGYPTNPGAFAVQSGYEGYLVPSPIGQQPSTALYYPQNEEEDSAITTLTNLLPRSLVPTFGRAIAMLWGLLRVTLYGGSVTTALCTFTPLCTISFALPFIGLRATAKKIVEAIDVDKETSENVERAADFVQTAIEKFQKVQETADSIEPAKVEITKTEE